MGNCTCTPSSYGGLHDPGCPESAAVRDPDDIKLSGPPPRPRHWETPLSYTGTDGECWACGNDSTQVIELATSRYYLCRTCAMALEADVLSIAMDNLKKQSSKLRGETY